MKFCVKVRLVVRHSLKDIRRYFCHFSLSLFVIFLVMLSIMISQTLMEMGPTIFFRLSEKEAGQFDGLFENSYYDMAYDYEYNVMDANKNNLNYT